jgi:hypothetical protein
MTRPSPHKLLLIAIVVWVSASLFFDYLDNKDTQRDIQELVR